MKRTRRELCFNQVSIHQNRSNRTTVLQLPCERMSYTSRQLIHRSTYQLVSGLKAVVFLCRDERRSRRFKRYTPVIVQCHLLNTRARARVLHVTVLFVGLCSLFFFVSFTLLSPQTVGGTTAA